MSILKRGFFEEKLSGEEIAALNEQLTVSRGAIVKMTTLAGCGHPGGSLSSLETYTLLWQCANVDPKEPRKFGRDTIVVSHGHTSPGVYAALAGAGFIDLREAIVTFRQPPLEDLPHPGIKRASPVSLALTGGSFTSEPPGKPQILSLLFSC